MIFPPQPTRQLELQACATTLSFSSYSQSTKSGLGGFLRITGLFWNFLFQATKTPFFFFFLSRRAFVSYISPGLGAILSGGMDPLHFSCLMDEKLLEWVSWCGKTHLTWSWSPVQKKKCFLDKLGNDHQETWGAINWNQCQEVLFSSPKLSPQL